MSKNLRLAIILIVTAVCVSAVFLFFNGYERTTTEQGSKEVQLPYKDFLIKIDNHEVISITEFGIADKTIKGILKPKKLFTMTNPQSTDFKKFLLENGVEIKDKPFSSGVALGIVWFLQVVFPLLLFIGLIYLVMGKMITKQYSNGNANLLTFKKCSVTFNEVAGNEEAKENMKELVDFLKDPGIFTKYGIVPPKGTVLYGPPGTGKTLLAKALAGEADVPFISVSGSDFVEKFVGVGASRVRQLFEQARKNSPCIVFVDEIDALGKRSADGNGANSERDQTLNQLLVEIDGFSGSEGVLVIAATNRLDMLDPALIRSGRFDRQIQVNLPDVEARKAILEHHAKNKPLSEDVNLVEVARMTVYMSGADLANVLNEAGFYAIRNKNTVITMQDIDKAISKIHAGEEKKNKKGITLRDKKVTAYHEAGHTIAAKLLAGVTVSKVTIIPTTKGAGGYTMYLPEEKMFSTKSELLNEISILLAGRAAEEVIFGENDITNGASHDLKRATSIASDMVNHFGMSQAIGLVSFSSVGLTDNQVPRNQLSEKEVKKIIEDIYIATKRLLEKNKDCLENIALTLLERETIFRQDVDDIVEGTLWGRAKEEVHE